MPLYQYKCLVCHYTDEHLHNMHQELVTCPKCGEPTYEKQISGSSFELKGKDWYKPGVSVK